MSKDLPGDCGAEKPEVPQPNYEQLFMQGAVKLAEQGATLRAIEDAVPDRGFVAGKPLADRVCHIVILAANLKRELKDTADRLAASVGELAHVKQELGSAQAAVRLAEQEERTAIRSQRLFREGLRGQPYERDVVDLLERCLKAGAVS